MSDRRINHIVFPFLLLLLALICASASGPVVQEVQKKDLAIPASASQPQQQPPHQPVALVAEASPPLRGPPRPTIKAVDGAGETVVEVVIVKEIITLPTAAAILPSRSVSKAPVVTSKAPARTSAVRKSSASPKPVPSPRPSPSTKPTHSSVTSRPSAVKSSPTRTSSARTTSSPRSSAIKRTRSTQDDKEDKPSSSRSTVRRSAISKRLRPFVTRRGRKFKPFNVNQYNTEKKTRFQINNLDMIQRGMGNASDPRQPVSLIPIVAVLLSIPMLLFLI